MVETAGTKTETGIEERIARLESLIGEVDAKAQSAKDRAAIENVFAQYMYLHNAFRDADIIDLWVAKDTPGIRAQYSNNGVYTNWDSVTYYHRDRPAPHGKLILHFLTTPMVEVAEDGNTAKGLWIASGIESGLADLEVAKKAPEYMYDAETVEDKRVWQHTVFLKYGIDFLKQNGTWKIWHFHCFEVARSPFSLGWIPFAAKAQNDAFNYDLMYFGEDGRPVFMPKPDGPATVLMHPYRTDSSQTLDAKPPVPYRTIAETFEY